MTLYRRRSFRSFSRTSQSKAIARTGSHLRELLVDRRLYMDIYTNPNVNRFAPPPQLQTPVRQRRTLTTR